MIELQATEWPRSEQAEARPSLTRRRRMRQWLRRQTERAYTFAALNATRRHALRIPRFDVRRDRYVIFSDTHRGDRTPGSDEFQGNEDLYCHALTQYLDDDYRLVLNGDIEDGWKSSYGEVVKAYKESAVAVEREFARRGPGHYLRIFGNHDIELGLPDIADRLLSPVMGRRIRAHSGVMLGERIFITHGHQGDPSSERFAWLSRRVVHYLWRPLQRYLRYVPRYQAPRRAPHRGRDKHLSAWARASRLLLIAGHTHRVSLLSVLTGGNTSAGDYINGGCCVYDRALTGVEIDRGEIRLVKWEASPVPCAVEPPRREVLQAADLARYLRRL